VTRYGIGIKLTKAVGVHNTKSTRLTKVYVTNVNATHVRSYWSHYIFKSNENI